MAIEREDTLVHHSTYLTVPPQWLGEQFLVEAEHLKEVKPEAYRHEYLGEVTGTGGEVFANVTLRAITDEEISRFDKLRRGIDWGYAADPFAYNVCHYDKTRRRLYIFREIHKVKLSNRAAADLIKPEAGGARITCDSAEPKSIDEVKGYGLRVVGAKKGPDSVEYGVKWLQDLEEIIIDPARCPETAREFSGYELERDREGNFKAGYPDKDNHHIDAVRYACEGDMRRPGMKILNGEVISIDIQAIERIRQSQAQARMERVKATQEAERYYANITDIKVNKPKPSAAAAPDPVRSADNRLSHRWHGLLTDQKAAYVATYPPLIDLGSAGQNTRLQKLLGDRWGRDFRRLVVDATNSGCAWVHVWQEGGRREYGIVDSKQLTPVYAKGLRRELLAMLREYEETDDAGCRWTVLECWDAQECQVWRRKSAGAIPAEWKSYPCFAVYEADLLAGGSNVYRHGVGSVPFIPFPNNLLLKGDLHLMYKDLVDLYDRVSSGFANDIEDVQQIIYIITNYGGEDLGEFLNDLRRYKAIKVNNDGVSSGGGVSTLAIDIPVEARNSLLDRLRKDIITFGQGVDPDPDQIGNTSGVALKHKYGLLELKAGALETEFRPGVAQLVRLLLPDLPEDGAIKQTWTRNLVQNDLEQAQVVEMLAGVTSSAPWTKTTLW